MWLNGEDQCRLIDVGINRMENGKLVGDVDFDGVCQKRPTSRVFLAGSAP